ncbi:MAG: NADH-quinone oxidoreductase subunit L [Pirellulales bacterium]|nr:NADH-quinone oxidoreductase subunit L [Pirellulales bacterium]
MDHLASTLPTLLGLAWLVPLVSFTLIVLFGSRMGKAGVLAGYVATGAILTSFLLSLTSLGLWLSEVGPLPEGAPAAVAHDEEDAHAAEGHDTHAADEHAANAHAADEHGHDAHAAHAPVPPKYIAGVWYPLGIFDSLRIDIGYHIDALTVCMFAMVTLIASCIHFYAMGYMHDELHDITDHEVTLSNGHHLHRKGRFYRFFQYLSLFCFSMLGLVIAGNIAMVFVFWELVGICSYFLIGFYIERKSASNAANKAFIVNRVGDFGMIIGLMAIWGSLGTFNFGDIDGQQGIFSLVRPGPEYALTTPDGMVKSAAVEQIAAGEAPTPEKINEWRNNKFGYGLLIVAGLGIFCGCVGKSAQFPLHVWLPDAMEGPTPVSALVHSATMVAAGVYLVGRFYPVFTPEVLLVIAYTGAITLFLAATIAITATDIKRVLAYSTVSQLGYMMLALGGGGWFAGMYHLFTHAFFKSLLFMCAGSVIHAVHTNEMPQMGGLRKKMPWTAYTMLVGVLAIAGAGIPFVIGFSGFYSKDAILAQHLSFASTNSTHAILYYAAAGGAALTSFYMFRLWFMTFAGKPRDHHAYDHAHESPKIMYVPLVILSVFAVGVAWDLPFTDLSLQNLLEQARPAGEVGAGVLWDSLAYPAEHLSHAHEIHVEATLVATSAAIVGFLLALAFYGMHWLDAEDARRQFSPIYRFLVNKWYFDELYDFIFVRPVMFVSKLISDFDRKWIDAFIDSTAHWTKAIARFDDAFDRTVVDGLVNVLAAWTYSVAQSLRGIQTGRLRQYVMFIVVGTVGLFVLVSMFWSFAVAGG